MTWVIKNLQSNESQDLIHGFTVGRSDQNNWMVDDDSMSRRHARFEMHAKGLYVKDLHSANGVYVNAERVREAEIFPGDRIQLGESVFVVSSGSTTQLTVIREVGPTLNKNQSIEYKRCGWRTLCRQFLEKLSFLKASTLLIGVRIIKGVVVDQSVLIGRDIEMSSWLLDEGQQGSFLIAQQQIFEGRKSLIQRRIASVMVFPLGDGAFLWVETDDHELTQDAFTTVERLLAEFVPIFRLTIENWIEREKLPDLIVHDNVFKQIIDQAKKAAQSDISILLRGIAGTGKSLLAKHIHEWSSRNDEPCEILDLSQIPTDLVSSTLFGHEKGAFTGADQDREGILEIAHGGTLILENIDEINPQMQTLLLKVLEDRMCTRLGGTQKYKVDVRFVFTSKKDLSELSDQGQFRSDLFFRISALTLQLPCLDERSGDIQPLIRSLVDQLTRQQGKRDITINKDFFKKCSQKLWPGQVRELKNFLESCLVGLGDGQALTWPDLEAGPDSQLFLTIKELEKQHILSALKRTNGRKGDACSLLGITRPTLAKKMEDYGIKD